MLSWFGCWCEMSWCFSLIPRNEPGTQLLSACDHCRLAVRVRSQASDATSTSIIDRDRSR